MRRGAALLLCAASMLVGCSQRAALAPPPGPAQPGDELPLTGHIVDAAHVLPTATVRTLTATLAAYEGRTHHQIVVVTTPSLGGSTIDAYSLRLFNRWCIGRHGANDGVGLLVAPIEHRVRIEVGRGLERELSNAKAGQIIRENAIPRFKAGDVPDGVTTTVGKVIATLDCAEHRGC